MDGGKYRSIVKLQVINEGQGKRCAMGTGWLISPDILVTGGHIVYDWFGENGVAYGRAVAVNVRKKPHVLLSSPHRCSTSSNPHPHLIYAYIGYHGKKSLSSPIV
ncbi:hypothetical protein B0H63DRAFT_473521 [Podospora didyma]|uniref:Serine protease n=1 Tax=Podospora didyma TaxID=330526 RepID=A0AAE0U050_9PEZI|nr:hypothetical protein B0H63DRAFT_473521 [Podospora didyma]